MEPFYKFKILICGNLIWFGLMKLIVPKKVGNTGRGSASHKNIICCEKINLDTGNGSKYTEYRNMEKLPSSQTAVISSQ